MAESKSYWLCKCGTANLRGTRVCKSCGAKKSRLWLWIGGGALVLVLGLALLPAPEDTESAVEAAGLGESQGAFVDLIDAARTDYTEASNELQRKAVLQDRNRAVGELGEDSRVTGWSGTVHAIRATGDQAILSVMVGDAELVAGTYAFGTFDTLIEPDTELYEQVSRLEVGEEVVFSGRFETDEGAAIGVRLDGSASSRAPRYLFRFEEVRRPTSD